MEHAKWFGECTFVLLKKGHSFVNKVRRRHFPPEVNNSLYKNIYFNNFIFIKKKEETMFDVFQKAMRQLAVTAFGRSFEQKSESKNNLKSGGIRNERVAEHLRKILLLVLQNLEFIERFLGVQRVHGGSLKPENVAEKRDVAQLIDDVLWKYLAILFNSNRANPSVWETLIQIKCKDFLMIYLEGLCDEMNMYQLLPLLEYVHTLILEGNRQLRESVECPQDIAQEIAQENVGLQSVEKSLDQPLDQTDFEEYLELGGEEGEVGELEEELDRPTSPLSKRMKRDKHSS